MNSKDFGDIIKKLREAKGLSRDELAKNINISYSALSKYETNNRFPDKETITKIADYFNVSTDYLLGRTNQRNSQINLNEKDEKDIAKNMNILLEQLQNQQSALMFDGEALDDETRELLASSLENSLRMGKIIAKEKYTPKKYRNDK